MYLFLELQTKDPVLLSSLRNSPNRFSSDYTSAVDGSSISIGNFSDLLFVNVNTLGVFVVAVINECIQ